jgi:oligopeptide/dipeptide ABC transporter ATP-binding protein
MEMCDIDLLFDSPKHPYTQALISSIPEVTAAGDEKERIVLSGEIPSPTNPPSGCKFRTRCQYATDRCAEEEPELRDVGGGHCVACHYAE